MYHVFYKPRQVIDQLKKDHKIIHTNITLILASVFAGISSLFLYGQLTQRAFLVAGLITTGLYLGAIALSWLTDVGFYLLSKEQGFDHAFATITGATYIFALGIFVSAIISRLAYSVFGVVAVVVTTLLVASTILLAITTALKTAQTLYKTDLVTASIVLALIVLVVFVVVLPPVSMLFVQLL